LSPAGNDCTPTKERFEQKGGGMSHLVLWTTSTSRWGENSFPREGRKGNKLKNKRRWGDKWASSYSPAGI